MSAAGWLVAAVPGGVVCLGADTLVEVALDGPLEERVALAEAIFRDPSPGSLVRAADLDADDAAELARTLDGQGYAAREGDAPRDGLSLAEAIVRAGRGEAVTAAWTAEEALVLPLDVTAADARRAVRAFVAGIEPFARLDAYCQVARARRRTAWGDVPEPGVLAEAMGAARAADPSAAHAVRLTDGRRWSAPVGEVDALGVAAPHRLGTVLAVEELALGEPLRGRRASFTAAYAVANLRYPVRPLVRLGRGTSVSRKAAERMARAEAAERHAAGDLDPRRLRRAAIAELDAPLDPGELYSFGRRQLAEHDDIAAHDPDDRIAWIEGRALNGDARWAPAEAVYLSPSDPGAPIRMPVSSSGLAAGDTVPEAAERALRELVERDAFMWTWVHRLARERVDPATLRADVRELVGATERLGFGVALVNVTLDTKPVVLAVAHREDRLFVSSACRDDAMEAAAKAMDEAALLVAANAPLAPPPVAPRDVRTVADHLRVAQTAEYVAQVGFLLGSDDVIDVRDIASVPGPVGDAVRTLGEPVLVDLSSPRSSPFRVVRALVPGLVPISFGWDREPLGMPRLAAPARTADDRTLGSALDLDDAPAMMPHPFS